MVVSRATILVRDSSELREAYEALSNGGGGTIEIAAGRKPMEIALQDGGPAAVHITSADADDPTLLHRIATDNVSNVTISGFRVDSTGVDRPGWHNDLMVVDSENVAIEDNVFTSDAVGRYDRDDDDAHLGEVFAMIRGSSDFVFSGNTVSNYYQGLTLREISGASISDNEFTQMQGDGIRMAGVQKVDIVDNHMHDFLGTTNSFNHNDFIQLWSTNTKLVTSDLVISGNLLDAGEGSSAQGIFLGNERAGKGEDHVYRNIEISENVIHTGNPNGIAVFHATGVEVTDNTLLWNPQAEVIHDVGDKGVSRAPQIRLGEVESGLVADNIASAIVVHTDKVDVAGNRIVTYDSAADPDYVGNHFVNAAEGGALSPSDLRLLPDSDWNGTAGSPLSEALTHSADGLRAAFVVEQSGDDLHSYTFDAYPSVDKAGFIDDSYDIRWTTSDGTVLHGLRVAHTFDGDGPKDVTLEILRDGKLLAQDGRSFSVASKDYILLDLKEGLDDTSGYDTDVDIVGKDGSVYSGYRIGGENRLSISEDSPQIHDLSSFGIRMEMKVLNGDDGRFLLLHGSLEARVEKDGTLEFTLHTDEGKFTVKSGDITVDDGAFHTLEFGYDGKALTLHVDDVAAGETAAGGTTASQGYQDLVIGSKWHAGVDAVVKTFHMGADPQTVGIAAKSAKTVSAKDSPAQDAHLSPEDIGDLLIDVDFEAGGTNGADLRYFSQDALQENGKDGTSYAIEKGQTLQVGRWIDDIHNMEAFSLEMDVRADTGDLEGTLLHFHKVLKVKATDDGRLRFMLETDEGDFAIEADAGVLSDGAEHRLGISYDTDQGRMTMQIDGTTVAEGEASGVTADQSYYGLTVGHTWKQKFHDTYEMEVDDFVLATRVDDSPPQLLLNELIPVVAAPAPEDDDVSQIAASNSFFDTASIFDMI